MLLTNQNFRGTGNGKDARMPQIIDSGKSEGASLTRRSEVVKRKKYARLAGGEIQPAHIAETTAKDPFAEVDASGLKSGFDPGEFSPVHGKLNPGARKSRSEPETAAKDPFAEVDASGLKSGFDPGEFSPVHGKLNPGARKSRSKPENAQGSMARVAAALMPGLKPELKVRRKEGADAVATPARKVVKPLTRGR